MSILVNGAEDRVFGNGPFKAYPMVSANVYARFKQLKSSIRPKLVVIGCLTAFSSFIIFLLGVCIVIQYRTIRLDRHLEMFKKLCIIALSILGIVQVIRLIAWLFDHWNGTYNGSINNANNSRRRGYSRLRT
ncbi:hypothetical protein C6P45_003484 [Maudiozyma exigua]|uniref:Uncharacterized protein n=1 Tax=Maudiozyma exigua TaxID=34358 RepID=A0A9P6WCX1_MAUEX|nr:hypothetical protein C6P45_003484 [Kazachstania exigua]